MTNLKYSPVLLQDFAKLLTDLTYFMSLNLVHADKDVSPQNQQIMRDFIKYSLGQVGTIADFFKQPILSNETANKEKFLKNFSQLLQWIHEYVAYAESRLQQSKSPLFSGRFTQIKKHYLEFRAKYSV